MLKRLGPAGLLRLTAVIALGASLLLSGCGSAPHVASQVTAEPKEGWSRCDRAHAVTFSVVCIQR